MLRGKHTEVLVTLHFSPPHPTADWENVKCFSLGLGGEGQEEKKERRRKKEGKKVSWGQGQVPDAEKDPDKRRARGTGLPALYWEIPGQATLTLGFSLPAVLPRESLKTGGGGF